MAKENLKKGLALATGGLALMAIAPEFYVPAVVGGNIISASMGMAGMGMLAIGGMEAVGMFEKEKLTKKIKDVV
jgi:hypothetical protein